MRELVRQHLRFFLLATAAGLALRLLFVIRFPAVTVDSFLYGDIAKNWLQHGIYGLSGPEEISPTDIRLPGYPAFLALIFSVFGMEHYRAVLIAQVFVDLGSCFLIADLTRRVISPRAAKAAFLLATLCPFLADYSAAALTETLEIFFTTLALDLAVVGLDCEPGAGSRMGRLLSDCSLTWIGCGLAVAAAILLRPDGGLLLLALLLYLGWLALERIRRGGSLAYVGMAAAMLTVGALSPLLPWTVRNSRTFHRFQPLAPRYANEPGEFVPMGFNHWIKTWIIDYASVEEIYWPVPGDAIDASKLPNRAFDSEQQRKQTLQLLSDYNQVFHIDPRLDARFHALADARIRAAPLRYYVWLPLLRILDMWLRPRTELLPADSRWWEFNDDPQWSALAISFGLIGIFYIGAAILGLRHAAAIRHIGLLLMFLVIRSAFLGTLENPEPRYTLECYPVLIVVLSKLGDSKKAQSAYKNL